MESTLSNEIDYVSYEKLLSILPEEMQTKYPFTIKDTIKFTQNELKLHYMQNYEKRFFPSHSKDKKGGLPTKPSNIILYLY